MKTKEMTIHTSPEKVKSQIMTLEKSLSETKNPQMRSQIKKSLTALYKLRKKQKNYTPPPRKLKINGL